MKSRNSLLKALAAVMAASMILTVAGCGGGGNSSTALPKRNLPQRNPQTAVTQAPR